MDDAERDALSRFDRHVGCMTDLQGSAQNLRARFLAMAHERSGALAKVAELTERSNRQAACLRMLATLEVEDADLIEDGEDAIVWLQPPGRSVAASGGSVLAPFPIPTDLMENV